MAYEIVPYAPEFDPHIVELQTHLWGSDAVRNAAYLRWKYTDNPFLNETLIRLALCDGRVVGMHGLFGALWQVDDTTMRHLLPHGDDFVVAPEHRNRGVSRQVIKANIEEACRRGFPFAVSLSASPVTFIIALTLGWRSAGSYESAWRGAPRGTLMDRLWGRLRRRLSQARLDPILRALRRAPFDRLDGEAQRNGRVSLSREARPEEMAALVARLPWDGRLRHARDAAYFAWRFRNPLHEYRFLYWDDNRLQGYLVLQRYLSERADHAGVNIADWEGWEEGVQADLLEAALRWGRFRRIHTWTVNLREPVKTLLRDHGFELSKPADVRARSNGLLVHRCATLQTEPWRLGSRDLLNIADWDLRMLYSMEA